MAFRRRPAVSRHVRLGAVVVIAVALFVASVVPSQAVPQGESVAGLSVFALFHVISYATLAVVLAYSAVDVARSPRLLLLAVFVGTVSYGAAIEGVQSLLSYRFFSVRDIGLNALGATLGIGIWWLLDSWTNWSQAGES